MACATLVVSGADSCGLLGLGRGDIDPTKLILIRTPSFFGQVALNSSLVFRTKIKVSLLYFFSFLLSVPIPGIRSRGKNTSKDPFLDIGLPSPLFRGRIILDNKERSGVFPTSPSPRLFLSVAPLAHFSTYLASKLLIPHPSHLSKYVSFSNYCQGCTASDMSKEEKLIRRATAGVLVDVKT